MEPNKIISPYFENGTFAGVRVCIGDEDFVIAPNDYNYGERMTWNDAMDALKYNNLDTWNYRQICLTMAYRKEIDKMLVDSGGDKLNGCWIREEIAPTHAFVYHSSYYGFLDACHKSFIFTVRPIKNLKEE